MGEGDERKNHNSSPLIVIVININMNTKDKYWDIHKEIYFNELDSLEFEIRDIIMNKPHDSTTIRFNSKIDKMVEDRLQESND